MHPLAMLALAALQIPSQAEPRLGYMMASDLVARCTAGPRQSPDYCFGYIASVYDTVHAYEAWFNMREFCIPAATAQSQLRDVVLNYMQRHQDQLTGQAASVVVLALREHFACAATAGRPARAPTSPAAPVPIPAATPLPSPTSTPTPPPQ